MIDELVGEIKPLTSMRSTYTGNENGELKGLSPSFLNTKTFGVLN